MQPSSSSSSASSASSAGRLRRLRRLESSKLRPLDPTQQPTEHTQHVPHEKKMENDDTLPPAAPHLQEQQEQGVEEEAAISLYVSNIASNVDEASLHDIFGKIGELQSVKMPLNPLTRESRGFAFVVFRSNADGERAVTELNEFEAGGRKLRVEQSHRKSGYAKSPGQYLGPAWASIKHNPDGAVRPGGGGPGGRGPESGRGYRSNDSRPYSPPRYDDGRGRPAPRGGGGGGGGDRERDFYRERDERDYRRDGGRAPPPRDAGPPPRDRYYDERPDERRGDRRGPRPRPRPRPKASLGVDGTPRPRPSRQ